jgi:hypothetical protein
MLLKEIIPSSVMQDLIAYFTSSFSSSIVDTTSDDLFISINNSTLVSGRWYLLSDFQTVYDQPDYNAMGIPKATVSTLTGPVEPLLVLAISDSEIATQVYSAMYPDDTIFYDHTFTETEIMHAPAKGRITKRIDNDNNQTGYDHRHVVFKRYETAPGSGIFTVINDNGGSYNAAIPTFGADCENMTLSDVHTDFGFDDPVFIMPNSVFGTNCEAVVTMGDFYNNTIGDVCYGVTFGHWCHDNVIGTDFNNNHILNEFSWNTVGNSCNNNYIGNSFQSNTIGDSFVSNNIGNGFGQGTGNTIGDSFFSNTIGNGFVDNSVGIEFQKNVIGAEMQGNTILYGFQNNNIGNSFANNNIAEYFYANVIGIEFQGSIIAAGFTDNNIGNYNGNITTTDAFRFTAIDNFSSADLNFDRATYVKQAYSKHIFRNQAGESKLSYFNNSNALTVVAPTA